MIEVAHFGSNLKILAWNTLSGKWGRVRLSLGLLERQLSIRFRRRLSGTRTGTSTSYRDLIYSDNGCFTWLRSNWTLEINIVAGPNFVHYRTIAKCWIFSQNKIENFRISDFESGLNGPSSTYVRRFLFSILKAHLVPGT